VSAPGSDPKTVRLGAVAIGRNEGQRLVRCLDSLLTQGLSVVYVDSGSSDGSREAARARGVEVVELDLSRPFTAARARNAGFARLIERHPEVEFVQFIDGDCELVPDWIERGLTALLADPELVAVCAQRKERFPEASPFNRLCDLEWNTPVGEAEACGGDALLRRAAFAAVEGFNPSLIAGEEPELCYRLRQRGGKIQRLPGLITWHDAAMTRFGQWWRRTKRSGHAAAEAWALHGPRGQGQMVRIAQSALLYALVLPGLALVAVVSLCLTGRGTLSWLPPFLLLAAYGRLVSKVRTQRIARGDPPSSAALYARYTFLGKFAEAAGILSFWKHRLLGRRAGLIEYK
jgi:GT2 family glycosyltransferase